MAAIQASAHVQGTHTLGCSAVPPENILRNLPSLFTTDLAAPNGDGERAVKRRKLDKYNSVGVQPTAVFDERNSAVLARITLGLHFQSTAPTAQFVEVESSDPTSTPLVVSLESFSKTCANSFSISLRSTTIFESGLDIMATTASDVLGSIETHLQTAVALGSTENRKKRSSRPIACFSRCLLFPPTEDQDSIRLVVEIRWLLGVSLVDSIGRKSAYALKDLNILTSYFPEKNTESHVPWALSDFYDCVHVPPDDMKVSPRIQQSLPGTTLFPFQQRTVDWLLRREGVAYSASGEQLLPTDESSLFPPVSFQAVQDAGGKDIYISHMRAMVVADLSATSDSCRTLRGGILAEEMGLGKTVELVALMTHNKRQIPDDKVFDAYTGSLVMPSGATLIITPQSILQQWIDELGTHAPNLKVMHYKGLPLSSASKKEKERAGATVENLMRYDVVLTTYHVLTREVHFATPVPDRSFRSEKQYVALKSPLVEISWWRVCIDEAQIIESGVSHAAKVARIIPRCNAWAVSGTPLRNDIQDLRGLLLFLRCEPFAGSSALWSRLDKPSFRAIFSRIALRHTKEKIRNELQLAPQKRIVVTVPFTAIEEQNYSEMVRNMCDDCDLSPEGRHLLDDQDINRPKHIHLMREWLVRLRQTCLHAHVGSKNRKALGVRHGPLRTVQEVLEVMIEQNDTLLKSGAREYILAKIRSGHIKGNARDDEYRSETALPFYRQALKEVQEYAQACRDDIVQEIEELGISSVDINQDADGEDKEIQNLGRIPTIRKSLRLFLELEHACKFFIGTVYFQLKSNEKLTIPGSESFQRLEKLETEWYDEAKKLRKELLIETEERAQRQMYRISAGTPFCELTRIDDLPDLGGIEGKKILDMMDRVCDTLNAQATQIEAWRQKIVDILLLPLVDEDEDKETTGEEYEYSTKVQDELYVFIMGLRALTEDRSVVLNGQHDKFFESHMEHELKQADSLAREKKGHAPELTLQVVGICRKLKPKDVNESLKRVVICTRSLLKSLEYRTETGDKRAMAELSIVHKQFNGIQKVATEQAKALAELEKEQDLFRTAMNQRLEFYRQLQHISDTVAPWKEELDPTFDAQEFKVQTEKELLITKQLAKYQKKHRYLVNLRDTNQRVDAKRECTICQDEFELGVITSCGHEYCKDCIKKWWHSHRNCPLCKTKLRSDDILDISFKPTPIRAQEEVHGQPSSPQTCTPAKTFIYSDISGSVMSEIKTIDIEGSYGSKVDMIARHLIWIRNNDPGAKSIIFSQFGDFLEVLRDALRRWKIGCSSIRDKNGISIFRSDPAVECFLLDAKSDSSGLNLINATYVFLCEPLINPAIELQAIARVHRIGQQRPTTVFMYLVSDTVEEAIYEISVARRLEHMGRGSSKENSRQGTTMPTPVLQEQTLDAANSMELQAAPLNRLLGKKGDGEVVQAKDVWQCLFGKPRKPRKQKSVVLEQEVGRLRRTNAAEQRVEVGRHLRANAAEQRVDEE